MRLGTHSLPGTDTFKVMGSTGALSPPTPSLPVSALCTPCLQILCRLHLPGFFLQLHYPDAGDKQVRDPQAREALILKNRTPGSSRPLAHTFFPCPLPLGSGH